MPLRHAQSSKVEADRPAKRRSIAILLMVVGALSGVAAVGLSVKTHQTMLLEERHLRDWALVSDALGEAQVDAVKLTGPPNDVFTSRDVAGERVSLASIAEACRDRFEALEVRLADLRAMDDAIAAHALRALSERVAAHVALGRQTIDQFESGDEAGAIQSMVRADAAGRDVMQHVSELRQAITRVRNASLERHARDEQSDYLRSVGAIGLTLLTAASAVVWGMVQSRRDARTSARLRDAMRERDEAGREVEFLRKAIDEHAIVSVADARGTITYANDRFCQISGYTRDELLGQNHRILNSRYHPKSFFGRMYATLAQGQAWTAEICNRAKDGHKYWVLSTIVPFMDASGKPERYVSMRTDISERKRMEQALELALQQAQESEARLAEATREAQAANVAKSEFLANMSHEIRTPLTAILGYADLLVEEGDLTKAPDHRLESVQTIKRAGQHLLTIINDILDLSKIEAGQLSVEALACDPVQIIRDVDRLWRARAREKGIAIEAIVRGPVPSSVRSDPTRLRQIIMNLVGNAVKFTSVGRVTLSISATPLGESGQTELLVDVADTGIGITQEQAARLFQPFAQADSGMSRRFGGTGLGLTISRRLAKMLGGDVVLLRSEQGVGSTFRVRVRAEVGEDATMIESIEQSPMESREGEKSASATIRLSGKILLVEDGVDNQRLIAFHLRKAGATVEIRENGLLGMEAALAAQAAGEPFGVVLMDMQMPVMDGYTAATRLRAQGYARPVIALTAHAMSEDRDKCLAAGCDDFLTKPIEKASLIESCARWSAAGARGADAPRARAA
jgi:PAS domain S-box-containing protein